MIFSTLCGAEELDLNFKTLLAKIPSEEASLLPVHDRGRFKPFQTYAREKMLFISGKYSPMGQDPVKMFFALIVAPELTSQTMPLINIRSVKVRKILGFSSDQRFVSLKALKETRLEAMASPLIAREKENARLLTADEKDVLELFGQYWTLEGVLSARGFFEVINVSGHGKEEAQSEETNIATKFLRSLNSDDQAQTRLELKNLHERLKLNMMKTEGASSPSKISLEIFYNKLRPFFISALLFFAIFLASFTAKGRKFLLESKFKWPIFVPIIFLFLGFFIRVYITGFAPVTNMYGTMIWVSFGISVFSIVFYAIYKNLDVLKLSWLSAGIFLLLTESIPLTLSPDLDPIVAVLRSNMWLTIHVLTIVISYSAFTMAMMLGNYILIQNYLKKPATDFNLNIISHYIYRLIQLGVFLLTVGIILGGIWADYSWGRFWGWDPKETCALIADMGYLILLHGRFVGWVTPYRLAFLAPIAYFLVVFAWYGVNFILATGLHSYGFSSGGVTVVVTYVIIQLIILGVVSFKNMNSKEIAA